MSRVEDLITALCPNGVEFKTLGEVGEFIRGNGLQKSDLASAGVPAIHYGQIHTTYNTWTTETLSYVTPTLAKRLRKAEPGDLVIATTSENDEAVGKAVAWLGDREAAVSGDAYIYRHSLEPKYVSYFFQSDQFQGQKKRNITGTKVKRISGEKLATIRIPFPPIEVQQEIVKILDLFSELEGELEAELEARQLQYNYYRKQLLTFPKGEVTWVPLGDFLEMRAGDSISASDISITQDDEHSYPCFGGGGLRGFSGKWNREGDYVLIGRQGALCGNVTRSRGRFLATEHSIAASAKNGADIAWAYHALAAMNLNQYASQSAQPGLNVGNILKLHLGVPSIEEQRRVGSILDKFDELVNDPSVGLPAELAARRKQYEYYRDRLMTFEETVA